MLWRRSLAGIQGGPDREAICARYVADQRHAAQKAGWTIFDPDSLHLVQREAVEHAQALGQVIQLGADLFFPLEDIAFLGGVAIALRSPLPRRRQFVVRGLEAVVH